MSKRVEHVYLDLDDVLVDFRTACCKLLKINPRDCFEQSRKKGVWSIAEAIGIHQQYLWDELNAAGSAFWEHLQPLPYAEGLIEMVGGINGSRDPNGPRNMGLRGYQLSKFCSILTHTGPDEQELVYHGKKRLLSRMFTEGLGNVDICKDKTIHAQPGNVLIDDCPDVCKRWEARGGYAVQFPSPVYHPEVIEQGTQLKFVRERLYKALLEA
jgi:hypothetical protein